MRFAPFAPLAAAALAVALASGCDDARPLEQRSSATACERCHGFPPPAPHPQSTSCEVCHGTTVGEGGQLIPGGTHLNGVAGDLFAHPVPYVAQHVNAVYGGLDGCTICHGTNFDQARSCNGCHGTLGFADWRTNCTFCHGTRTAGWTAAQIALAAPPEAARPSNDAVPNYPGIGAHRAHVQADTFSTPIACTECHPPVADLSHFNGATQLAWGSVATDGGTPATYDDATTSCSNYCHGATLPFAEARTAPVWAPASTVACGACHEASPTTGVHPDAATQGPGHDTFECFICHGGTHTAAQADRARHVNGTLETSTIAGFDPATRSCSNTCHGARDWD